MTRSRRQPSASQLLAAVVLATLHACARDSFTSDANPIAVQSTDGMIRTQVATAGSAPVAAVVDVLSPLTVLLAQPGADIERRAETLFLYGQGDVAVPRAALGFYFRFPFCEQPTCLAGSSAAPTAIAAIVGADTLAGDAMRVNFPTQQLFIFPDIVGTLQERSRSCDVVLAAPYYGGGSIFVRGTEVALGARRPIVDACVNGQITPATVGSGVNTLFALSTALPTSLLGEATYERLRLADPTLPALASLPAADIYYTGTQIQGRMAAIPQVIVTSKPTATAGDAGGVCEALMRRAQVLIDLPCEDEGQCINLPALATLSPPEGIAFLVVTDELPLLQALRAELRENELPEIDGVLGGNALAASEIDFDYPGNRILWRCRAAGCRAEPLFARAQKDDLAACFTPPAMP